MTESTSAAIVSTRKRLLFVIVGAAAVLALVAASIVWIQHRPEHRVQTQLGDGTVVTVNAPPAAGTPRITERPKPDRASVPVATAVVSAVAHIESKPFDDDATVTMSFDPAKLPDHLDARSDLFIMSYSDAVGLWLPVDGDVDTAHHRISVVTPHFSDWVVGITDPEELTRQREAEERLRNSRGGKLGAMIVGEEASLTCNPKNLLLKAAACSEAGFRSKLCEEVVADGSYRLRWVNTTPFPMVFDLPDGVAEERPNQNVDVLVQRAINRLNHDKHPHARIDPRRAQHGPALRERGRGPRHRHPRRHRLGPGLPLHGTRSHLRLVARGREQQPEGSGRHRPSLRQRGGIGLRRAGERMHESGDKAKALSDGIEECSPIIAKRLGDLAGALWSKAKKFLKWVKKRVVGFLSIPGIMKTARTWLATLITAPYVTLGLDTSVTVKPTRVMSFEETKTLHLAGQDPNLERTRTCNLLSSTDFLPAGMPSKSLCYSVVTRDLDGNGELDSLVLWRPRLTDFEVDPAQLGATVYLDDGTFHLLENPPSTWRDTFDEFNAFNYATALNLLTGSKRDQIVVGVLLGANTDHNVILALDATRRLRAISSTDADTSVAEVLYGGSVNTSERYGCVLSNGKRLFVEKGATMDFARPTVYEWSLTYYAFDGRRLNRKGSISGTSPDNGSGSLNESTPHNFSNCSTEEPPEIGPVPKGP